MTPLRKKIEDAAKELSRTAIAVLERLASAGRGFEARELQDDVPMVPQMLAAAVQQLRNGGLVRVHDGLAAATVRGHSAVGAQPFRVGDVVKIRARIGDTEAFVVRVTKASVWVRIVVSLRTTNGRPLALVPAFSATEGSCLRFTKRPDGSYRYRSGLLDFFGWCRVPS